MPEDTTRFEITLIADFPDTTTRELERMHFARRVTLTRQQLIDLLTHADDQPINVRVVPATLPEM